MYMEEKPTFIEEDYQESIDALRKSAQNNIIKMKDIEKLKLDLENCNV